MNVHNIRTKAFVIITALLLAGLQPLSAQEEQTQTQESLYDRLGGLAPISVVVSDFLDALVPDPILNENPAIDAARKSVPTPYLKYHVTALVCQASGGPCQYHGRDMKESHAHLNISETEWERMVTIFKELLAKHQVPEQETTELLAIIDSTKADIVIAKMDME
ncbi:group I truncated hemoglobin [Methylophaga sp. OBS4]|uniref:group I truncated hemoglobin n=1 Tax=Methylophaga sp. OBS4 TaxID=2991935 RepID=UPI00225350B1|nr:group 1 truncated hemoglobin [Methylophaga sp. OBS4]MCX4188044.1 group 1 truncated hemoglobin [Methylophaga sp. OBS4]